MFLNKLLHLPVKLFEVNILVYEVAGTAPDERIARVIDLDTCGIDVMARDLSTPIRKNGGAVIEVNAAPGCRTHLQPSYGRRCNVAACA
jgi:hypothetical protein